MSFSTSRIYSIISAIVVSSTIFLWPIEFGPNNYDVGINVYISIASFIIFLPYIYRNIDPFPIIISAILLTQHVIFSLYNGIDYRSTIMILVFILYFVAVYYSLRFCLQDNFHTLRYAILTMLIAQLSFQVLDILDIYHLYDFNTVRMYIFGSIGSTGLYGEGSHVALCLVPLVFLKNRYGHHLNAISILTSVSIALAVSATAFLGIVLLTVLLIVKVNTWPRQVAALGLVVGSISLVLVGWYIFGLEFLSPIARRFYGVFEVMTGTIEPGVNLSAMVYANGVHMALAGLMDIVGSGIGNFSIYFDGAVASSAIERISHGQLNKDDGSCVLLKLIGETGIFGLALVTYFGLSCLAIINKFGNCTISVIACFLVMAAIRSAGYFHGPFVLSFALVGVLWQMGEIWPRTFLNRRTTLISVPELPDPHPNTIQNG